MSWLLIFSSAFAPILMLVAISAAESLRHTATKPCLVSVPGRGTKGVRITQR